MNYQQNQHQPPYYQQQPQVQHIVHYHQAPLKSSGTAAVLEVIPGFFFQTFGIGHLYAGNTAVGLIFMFGYWFVFFINILLCALLIGFITLPLCWIVMMIMSPILASNAANKARY
jgi:TM2 domain-containing membrane protein YozV